MLRKSNTRPPLAVLTFGLLLGLAPVPSQAVGTNTLLFLEPFERSLTGRWEQLRFGRPTDYSLDHDGTAPCLRALADQTCSAFMTKVDLKPAARLMARWKWKIDHIPAQATDRHASSFDHTARLIIAFDTFWGPPRTLNYLWANQEPIGTPLSHPLCNRAQMIVLESGNQKAGRWMAEERDVTADWHQLFGARPLPAVVAIGVITDSENTGTRVTAYYQRIELRSE